MIDNNTTLKQLIVMSKKGDHGAFRALTLHFDSRVFSYLATRTGSREEALDLLQNVLLELWKSLPSFIYKTDNEFLGFVFLIARRQLYKSWGEEKTESLDDEDNGIEPSELPHSERIQDVSDALRTLDHTAQEIVSLKHWSRYSFKEIGELLNMGESAVRVRHHRAVKRLAAILKEYD